MTSIDDYTAPRIAKAAYQSKAGEREANLNKSVNTLLREIAIAGFEDFRQKKSKITEYRARDAWKAGFAEFAEEKYLTFLGTYLREHAQEYLGDTPENLKEVQEHIAGMPALNGIEFRDGIPQAYLESRSSTERFNMLSRSIRETITEQWHKSEEESEADFRARVSQALASHGLEAELK